MAPDGKRLSTISGINYWTTGFAITGEGNILIPFYTESDGYPITKLREYSPEGKLISEKAFPKNLYSIFHIEQN
ncbi:MAG: hypothetical protein ABIH04_03285 [Planctomycetota bacterium]